jgi:putative effector of murein hydrolase
VEIAHVIGGVPAVTGVQTIPTGIIGAVTGPYVLDLAGIRTPEARGFSPGVQATASRPCALSARVKSPEALRAWAWSSTPS